MKIIVTNRVGTVEKDVPDEVAQHLINAGIAVPKRRVPERATKRPGEVRHAEKDFHGSDK